MLFSNLEKKVAFRYLFAKKRGFGSFVSWVSLIGITLGVATLIVVMSVMGGFHDALLSRIVGMNGHVVVYHQRGAISDYDFLINKIRQNTVVSKYTTSIVPIAEGQVMISANGENFGAMVRGIRMPDLKQKIDTGTRIYGKNIDNISGDEVILGASLSRNLHLSLNNDVSLISANGGTPTAFGTMPRIMSYPVVSTFFMGMYEYDSGYVFMPLTTAQKYLNIGDAVTHIDLFLTDAEQSERVVETLTTLL
ncbi:MAG: ABC transporter permease, partial [Alphaproteobacteria bacterium]|nr:ABC transporter permease [Alphaproteobacteria bacterium]